jgi:hypothetical protein
MSEELREQGADTTPAETEDGRINGCRTDELLARGAAAGETAAEGAAGEAGTVAFPYAAAGAAFTN